MAERRHRFFVASELCERDARERVDQRKMAPIAGGVQRGPGFGDVLANNRAVTDLAITLPEFVMGEADGARVVRRLGLFQRPAVKGDRARLIAPRRRQAPVEAPERRESYGR